jgi:Holliday junction resolvasome RuvABC endonuclease subunit
MTLILPDKDSFMIIGIDPGLNYCGISLVKAGAATQDLLSIDAFTIINDKVQDNTGLRAELCSEKVIKLHKLKGVISNLIGQVKPTLVVSESPFYNRLRPMAYGALLEVIGMIQTAVLEHNNNTVFSTVEPLLVKKTVGAGMQTGKLDVKEAIKTNNEIMSVLKQDIDHLDEHSIDAIAVAYTFLKTRSF